MVTKIDNKKLYDVLMILGLIIIGVFIFLRIYGIDIINVTYDDWLFKAGDLAQHYFGWLYYRKGEWQFPIGNYNGLSDLDTCIIYTDSIPIMAILFKTIRSVLPTTFQYFGIWGLLSFILTAVLSGILIKRFNGNLFVCWAGSIFYTMSPYILQRMYTHTALAGQWIIILFLIIWFYDLGSKNILRKILIWSLIMGGSTLVHVYYLPMSVIFCLFDAIRCFTKGKKILHSILCFLAPILFTFVLLKGVGAFDSASGEFTAEGLGYFSANLNCFFNPIFGISYFLKQLPCGGGQYEGLGYLGLGIICLLVICIYILITNFDKVKKVLVREKYNVALLLGICICFFVLALSPTIMFGGEILFTVKWPDFIIKILSIFRSSGRFIWPVCYIVYTFVIYIISKVNKNQVVIISIIIFGVVIQVLDLTPQILVVKDSFNGEESEYVSPITEDAWNILLTGKKKVVFMPRDSIFEANNIESAYAIAKVAYKAGLNFNTFYITRQDFGQIQELDNKYYELLVENTIDKNVYIFWNVDKIFEEDYNVYFYVIDGIWVGVKEPIAGLEDLLVEIDGGKIKDHLQIQLNDLYIHTYDENIPVEENKEYLIIKERQMMFGPYYFMKKGKYEIMIYGENLDIMQWESASYELNQTFMCETDECSSNLVKITIDLPVNVSNWEIKGMNWEKETVRIDSMYISSIE